MKIELNANDWLILKYYVYINAIIYININGVKKMHIILEHYLWSI